MFILYTDDVSCETLCSVAGRLTSDGLIFLNLESNIKLNKISQLFDKIDLNLKNCKIKYKNKNDIDNLYKNLTVFIKFFKILNLI